MAAFSGAVHFDRTQCASPLLVWMQPETRDDPLPFLITGTEDLSLTVDLRSDGLVCGKT
jgi:hypothetical protein